jgi:hypothetical protein
MVSDSFMGVAAAASVEEKEKRFHFTWRSLAWVGALKMAINLSAVSITACANLNNSMPFVCLFRQPHPARPAGRR